MHNNDNGNKIDLLWPLFRKILGPLTGSFVMGPLPESIKYMG